MPYTNLEADPLAMFLAEVKKMEKDGNYERRNNFVLHALSTAIDQGLKGGIRFDPREPEWPVVFIELPTGQVSWHIPQHTIVWDGHSTEEKYRRVDAYSEQAYSDDVPHSA